MAIATDDCFGEGLWQGRLTPFCTDAPWSGLRNFRVVSLGPAVPGRPSVLLVLGGQLADRYRNDVWRSRDDGQTWEEISPNDEGEAFNGQRIRKKWGGRVAFATAAGWMVEGGRLKSLVYVVGGLGPVSPPYADVWVSEDLGKTFIRMCANAPFGKRAGSGLAVCPGKPQRLVLVGGGWNDDVDRWDCWMSMNAGESWVEVQTPFNSRQRRMPAIFFTRLGTLLVFGGHDRHNAYDDAWVAKVQWPKAEVTWSRFKVQIGDGVTSLEDSEPRGRPWFLNHLTVLDLKKGVFTGFFKGGMVALGQLPRVVFMGKTPDSYKHEDLTVQISLCDHRLPIRLINNFASHVLGIYQNASHVSFQFLLPTDAMRLILVTDSKGVWATGGPPQEGHAEMRRQRSLLERLGIQIQETYGLPADIWNRTMVAVLGEIPSEFLRS